MNETAKHHTQADPATAGLAFARAVHEQPDKFIAAYLTRFGRSLAPEQACHLSLAYNATVETRPLYTPHLLGTALRILEMVWLKLLSDEQLDRDLPVLLLFGAAGAGRATITANPSTKLRAASSIAYKHQIVNPAAARETIEQALDAGRQVAITYIHRPAHLSTLGLISRALETGYVTPLNQIAREHRDSPGALLWLHKQFGRDPRVHFGTIDNSGAPEEIRTAPLALIREILRSRENLHATAIVQETFSNEIRRRADERAPISEEIYEAFTGERLTQPKEEAYETGRRELAPQPGPQVHNFRRRNEPDPAHEAFPAYDLVTREQQLEEHADAFGR